MGRPGRDLQPNMSNDQKNMEIYFLLFSGDHTHISKMSICPSRSTGACVRNASWCSFRKYALELYDRPSAPLEPKIRMLRAEVLETMLYCCVTWSPRACHYDTLHRVHHRFLTCCIGWRKKHNQSRRPPDFLSGHAGRPGSSEVPRNL